MQEIPKDNWFCCDDCNRIHGALQISVYTGMQRIPTSQLDIISRKYAEKRLLIDEDAHDVQWQILMGKSRRAEDFSSLSAAAAIFRVSFCWYLVGIIPSYCSSGTHSYDSENLMNLFLLFSIFVLKSYPCFCW